MNTPAHLIFGAAAFARPNRPAVTCAAIFGALAPDLSLYLMAGWHLTVLGTDARIVFDVLYFSDMWQQIFAIDNSFIIWGALLGLALGSGKAPFVAFAAAGLMHLALDFPLHNDDARLHFWPVSDWRFISPVSYWDRRHYGGVVGPIEISASLACLVLLWVRFRTVIPRIVILLAGALQLLPGLIWLFVFSG